jgi:type II restriction enzyme
MNLDLTNYYKVSKEVYKSKSQLARVITENWCNDNVYCPFCGNARILPYEKNKKVIDYFCDNCGEDFQLKAKKNNLGDRIVDGAYQPMIDAISENKTPNFLLMSYTGDFCNVKDLMLLPKKVILPNNIEKRKPLSSTARRAGWIGCNINIANVAENAKINIVSNYKVCSIDEVINTTKKSNSIFTDSIDDRSWINDVLLVVGNQGVVFTLSDIYKKEMFFKERHLGNSNIRAKIRQKLQRIRDLGYIEFIGNGVYKKL